MEKNLRYSLLLDIYSPLLTARQGELLSLYYNEDFSLAEIAEGFGISRQGAHDIIRRAEMALDAAESRLGLLGREQRMGAALERARAAALSLDDSDAKAAILSAIGEAMNILDQQEGGAANGF